FTPSLADVTLAYNTLPDTTAPGISSTTPAPGGTGVDLLAPVTVKFSELMSGASIGSATVRLRAVGAAGDVPATVTLVGSTATLTPLAALGYSQAYQV